MKHDGDNSNRSINDSSIFFSSNTADVMADDSSTALSPPKRLQNLPLLFKDLKLEQLTHQQQTLIAKIDNCLPQTQCGLCEHPDGCLPYATAIVVNNEAYNKCVPGGQPVTNAIASLLKTANTQPSLSAAPSKWRTNPNTGRPNEVRAVIREADCIGCTKCIPACPVDAIVGTGKHMHTIFTELCTGCELCLPPCPVDCIDLVEVSHAPSDAQRQLEQDDLRTRYHHHLNRVAEQLADPTHAKPVVSMVEAKLGNATHDGIQINQEDAKSTIAKAKQRSKIKKLNKKISMLQQQLITITDPQVKAKKQTELTQLNRELADLSEL